MCTFGGDATTVRDAHLLFVVARLAPGVALDAAGDHLARVAASLARAYPDTNTGLGGRVQPLHEAIVGDVRRPLWLLQAGVMVLWLVACVNVAHLLMGRASRRAHEFAVRVALGARRRDLVRQCLGEALAYALPGGALGLLLALWTVDGLVALAPPALPRLGEVAVEPQTVLAALVCTLGATLLVGLVPAWWTRGALAVGLQAATTRTSTAPGARRWQRGLVINAVGCVATTIVLGVVVASKFVYGAWIPVVVIPLIVLVFQRIHRHYLRTDQRLRADPGEKVRRRTNTVVVLVGKVTKGSLTAIGYARSLNPDRLVALTVVSNPEEQERIDRQWADHQIPVELVSLYSPYRELTRPILRYLDDLDDRYEDDFVTVIVPEFSLEHWWQKLLHNQSALLLRTRLRSRPNTVVTSVPFHIVGDHEVVASAVE